MRERDFVLSHPSAMKLRKGWGNQSSEDTEEFGHRLGRGRASMSKATQKAAECRFHG